MRYTIRRVALFKHHAETLDNDEVVPKGARLCYSIYENNPNGTQSWVSDHIRLLDAERRLVHLNRVIPSPKFFEEVGLISVLIRAGLVLLILSLLIAKAIL